MRLFQQAMKHFEMDIEVMPPDFSDSHSVDIPTLKQCG